MKNLIIASAMTAILMASCNKSDNTAPLENNEYKPLLRKGKEDEDKPILMQKVFGKFKISLPNARLKLISDGDTVFTETNETGDCQIELTHSGTWHKEISHDGYRLNVTEISISSPLTEMADTLAEN